MTFDFFQTHMNRLSGTFGAQHYKKDRVQILWSEVQDFSEFWFKRIVDRFIGESRQAPLLPDFRNEISAERERLWQMEKKKNAKEAVASMKSLFPKEEIASMCQGIRERVAGVMNDHDFYQFQKLIGSEIKLSKCRTCGNTGLVFHEDTVFKCRCSYGKQDNRAYPVWGQA